MLAFLAKPQLQNCSVENIFSIFIGAFWCGGASVLASRLGQSALFFNSRPAINSEF